MKSLRPICLTIWGYIIGCRYFLTVQEGKRPPVTRIFKMVRHNLIQLKIHRLQTNKIVKDFMVLASTIATRLKSVKPTKVRPMSPDKIFSNIN